MRKSSLLLCLAFVLPKLASAASGTEGATFLNIPLGGAPSAMGSAYSALATDVYAPVLNPAGLGFLNSNQIAGHHISYLETSHYDYISFVHPLSKRGGWGLSGQYLGTGDITQRDETGAALGDFSAHYSAFTLAYGQPITPRLSLGLSSKWINAKIDDVSANAYAADAGALMKFSKDFQGALVVSNVGSRLKFLNDSDPLPLTVRLGGAYFLPYQCTASAEGAYHSTGLLGGRFGAQWQPISYVALRAGYRTDIAKELSALAGFSTGVGLTFWGSEFAYTWMPYDDLGQTHSFALLLKFGEGKKTPNVIQQDTWKKPPVPEGATWEPDMTLLLSLVDESQTLAQGEGSHP